MILIIIGLISHVEIVIKRVTLEINIGLTHVKLKIIKERLFFIIVIEQVIIKRIINLE